MRFANTRLEIETKRLDRHLPAGKQESVMQWWSMELKGRFAQLDCGFHDAQLVMLYATLNGMTDLHGGDFYRPVSMVEGHPHSKAGCVFLELSKYFRTATTFSISSSASRAYEHFITSLSGCNNGGFTSRRDHQVHVPPR
jgi:hypothetical protein